ncbi:MAG: cupin domain-containing protein [Thermotogae bacterium]|nr:cupin domain-containing protein [Thermotogota bacterium]
MKKTKEIPVHIPYDGQTWPDGYPMRYRPYVKKVVLLGARNGLNFEVRYFEIQPKHASSLEKHEHQHAVIILKGKGWVFVGDTVYEVKPYDVVWIPSWTPHQLIAHEDEPLGFLCIVDTKRDRPIPLSKEEIERIKSDPQLAEKVKLP